MIFTQRRFGWHPLNHELSSLVAEEYNAHHIAGPTQKINSFPPVRTAAASQDGGKAVHPGGGEKDGDAKWPAECESAWGQPSDGKKPMTMTGLSPAAAALALFNNSLGSCQPTKYGGGLAATKRALAAAATAVGWVSPLTDSPMAALGHPACC